MSRLVTGRRVLLAAALAVCLGCQGSGGSVQPPVARGKTTPPFTPPPPPPAYAAAPSEPLAAMKTVAGRVAQALATFSPRAAATAPPPTLFRAGAAAFAAAAAPLAAPGKWSQADVRFVQLGGLSPLSARARTGVGMVVLEQRLFDPAGRRVTVTHTIDVRLRRTGASWQVERVVTVKTSPVGQPPAGDGLVSQVLRNDRIIMTDTSRADIRAGRVSMELLRVLQDLSRLATLSVSVLKTGHPRLVVDGRARPPVSSHFTGRAADIYALDGELVRPGSSPRLRQVVEAARSMPAVQQIGTPAGYDLDAGSRRMFSNLVHADHLHVAVGTRPTGDGG